MISKLGARLSRASVVVSLAGLFALFVLLRAPWTHAQPAPTAAPALPPLPGIALGSEHAVGAGVAIDNLTLFPVYAKEPKDLGDFTTLDRAIQAKEAEVREMGEGSESGSMGNGPSDSPSARVDTLVIQNKGKKSILVLAGTVVKGGKQDRQIGEDFVVEAGKTVDVAAFCVERGRWNGTRDGQSTGGRFVAQKTLAVSKVRQAGGYEGDQSAVWAEVGNTNAAHAKATSSGTLMATLDDPALQQKRAAIAQRGAQALASADQPGRVVGVAYAVNGDVLGVRWFAGPKLFALHQDTLLETAALEAITAQAEAKAAGKTASTASVSPARVKQFVENLEREAVAETKARAGQVHAKKKAADGYASELNFSDGAKPKPITKDFLKAAPKSAPEPVEQQVFRPMVKQRK